MARTRGGNHQPSARGRGSRGRSSRGGRVGRQQVPTGPRTPSQRKSRTNDEYRNLPVPGVEIDDFVPENETLQTSADPPMHGFFEAMKQYFLQQPPQPQIVIGGQGGMGGSNTRLEQFKRLGPAAFDGRPDPLFAERWMRQVEKTFEAIGCTDEQKVKFAAFNLEGKADAWWTTRQRILRTEGETIAWQDF